MLAHGRHLARLTSKAPAAEFWSQAPHRPGSGVSSALSHSQYLLILRQAVYGGYPPARRRRTTGPVWDLRRGPSHVITAGEAINLFFVGVEFNFRPTKFRKIP